MATRKVKRLAGGFDKGEFEGVDEAITANSDSGEWARGENYGDGTTGDERVAMARKTGPEASAAEVMAANKFADKPRPATPKPAITAAKKEVTKEIKAKTNELKDDQYNPDVKPKKKEMYRGFDGKMHEKAPDTSAADAARRRQKVGSMLESAGSSIGSYLKNLGKREETHGRYRGFDGKIHTYKSGGSASSRGDGIAQRGKTRGTMIMCGGGRVKK